MTSQITIIGLGQIGASIGLALEKYKGDLLRVGHDKNMSVSKDAQNLGAVDKVMRNLPSSVRDADIIILSLPFGEIRETLEYIAQDVKEDAIIFDTGTGKVAVHAWVQELLPAGPTYIGLVPVINASYLYEEPLGINAARKDLFENTPTMVAIPTTAPGDAAEAAVVFTQLIGSQPLFTDLYEADGLMASAHLLPQLTAVAFLNTTVNSAGWDETKKIAGRAFAEATRPILHHEGASSIAAAAFANQQSIAFKLDEMIASIQHMKSLLAAGDEEAFSAYLNDAQEGREGWDVERAAAKWLMADGPQMKLESPGLMARLFGYKQRK